MRLRFGPKDTNTRKSPDFKARCIGGYCPKHAYLKKHPYLGESHISSIRMYRGLLPETCHILKNITPIWENLTFRHSGRGFWAGVRVQYRSSCFPSGTHRPFHSGRAFSAHSSLFTAPRSPLTLHSSLFTTHCSLLTALLCWIWARQTGGNTSDRYARRAGLHGQVRHYHQGKQLFVCFPATGIALAVPSPT